MSWSIATIAKTHTKRSLFEEVNFFPTHVCFEVNYMTNSKIDCMDINGIALYRYLLAQAGKVFTSCYADPSWISMKLFAITLKSIRKLEKICCFLGVFSKNFNIIFLFGVDHDP